MPAASAMAPPNTPVSGSVPQVRKVSAERVRATRFRGVRRNASDWTSGTHIASATAEMMRERRTGINRGAMARTKGDAAPRKATADSTRVRVKRCASVAASRAARMEARPAVLRARPSSSTQADVLDPSRRYGETVTWMTSSDIAIPTNVIATARRKESWKITRSPAIFRSSQPFSDSLSRDAPRVRSSRKKAIET